MLLLTLFSENCGTTMDTAEYVEVKEVTTPLPDYFSYNPCEETFVPKTYKLDFVKRGECQEWSTAIKVFITSKHLSRRTLKYTLKYTVNIVSRGYILWIVVMTTYGRGKNFLMRGNSAA